MWLPYATVGWAFVEVGVRRRGDRYGLIVGWELR